MNQQHWPVESLRDGCCRASSLPRVFREVRAANDARNIAGSSAGWWFLSNLPGSSRSAGRRRVASYLPSFCSFRTLYYGSSRTQSEFVVCSQSLAQASLQVLLMAEHRENHDPGDIGRVCNHQDYALAPGQTVLRP